jgi:hypothetical protein
VWTGRLVFSSLFALGVTSAIASYIPSAIERTANTWESDPGRVRTRESTLRVGFAPVHGGGELRLGWTF